MKTKITLSGECGNSPKNAFAENFAVALMTADTDKLKDWLTDDCAATLATASETSGKSQTIEAIGGEITPPATLVMHHAITHGRVGAANGTLTQSGAEKRFALILEFKNTKAESITAFRLYFG